MKHSVKMAIRKYAQHNPWFLKLYGKASRIKTKASSTLTDEQFLKRTFLENTGKELKLGNPQSFSEKIQWLKLYDRNPLYTTMVDKYAVRDYIKSRTDELSLIPLLGVWDSFEEIDFSTLPQQFVLKCNHDSGSVIICKDKATLDMKAANRSLSLALKQNYYYVGREWPYKNVKPRIIAEQFMVDDSGEGLRDYKFFCFNGEPRFLYVGQGLTADHSLKIDFYDMDWQPTPFYRLDYERLGDIPKPSNFSQMVEMARALSKDIPFVRVDIYSINGKAYFSEFTFFPGGGHIPFEPKEYDMIIGSWLKLPKNRRLG